MTISVMEERLTLSSKELKRLKVLERVLAEQVTIAKGAELWWSASAIAGGCWAR